MNPFKRMAANRAKRDAAIAARRERIQEMLDKGMAKEEIVAEIILTGAVEDSLDAIDYSRKTANFITKVALWISLPHQMAFFLFITGSLHFAPGQPQQWLHPLTALSIAIGVPVACDMTIMLCVRQLVTKLASGGSIVRSFACLVAACSISCYVNYKADAPDPMLNKAAAIAVIFIPISQGLYAFFKLSAARMVKMKKAAAAEIPVPAVARAARRRISDREKRARDRANYSTLSRSKQAAWRKDWAAKHPDDVVGDALDTVQGTAERTLQNA